MKLDTRLIDDFRLTARCNLQLLVILGDRRTEARWIEARGTEARGTEARGD